MAQVKSFFEGTDVSHHYNKVRSQISDGILSKIISCLEEKLPAPHGLFVDVGCGTGLSTIRIADFAEKVLAVDYSESQTVEAQRSNSRPNIDYRVCEASEIPCGNEEADLVMVVQALHWFDRDRFYEECKRILRPNGLLVIAGSLHRACFTSGSDEELTQKLDQTMERFHNLLNEEKYAEENVLEIRQEYAQIELEVPFEKVLVIRGDPSLWTFRPTTLDDHMEFMSSWSSVRKYQEAHPDQNILQELKQT